MSTDVNLSSMVEPATLNTCAVRTSLRAVGMYASINDALEAPSRELPEGSVVVDTSGRVRARLEKVYSPAGRSVPVWVVVLR